MYNPFEITDELHAAASKSVLNGLKTVRVANAAFQNFSTALAAFEKHLNECDLADRWAPFLGFLKLSRLRYATTPLNASALFKTTRVRGTSANISSLLDVAETATHRVYEELDAAFKSLQREETNPLWTHFFEWQTPAENDDSPSAHETSQFQRPLRKIGILCFWNDLAREIEALVDSAQEHLGRQVFVIRPPQLKKTEIFDEIVIFGSLRWIERKGWSFIYDAPRARLVRALCFNGIPDYRPIFYQLEGSPHTFRGAAASIPRTAHGGFSSAVVSMETSWDQTPSNSVPVDSSEELDAMLPSLNLDSIPHVSVTALGNEDSHRVDSVLMELSGSRAVWLNPDGKVYRLELGGFGRNINCLGVSQADVGEVSPGDVLLFSTAGGGDMIAEEADRLMGDRAGAARQLQALWKQYLSTVLKAQGLEQTCRRLRNAGAAIATPQNVRNWIHPESIAPKKAEHFRAVLTECELSGKTAEIETATALIRKAHRIAGRRLSKKLMQMIRGRPLVELADHGHQCFGGNIAIASEKTAYMVESISQETRPIPAWELNKPFILGDDLWR